VGYSLRRFYCQSADFVAKPVLWHYCQRTAVQFCILPALCQFHSVKSRNGAFVRINTLWKCRLSRLELVRSAALIIRGEFYNGKWFVVHNNSQRTAMDWIGAWHRIVFIVVLVEKMVGRQANEQ
jgi:hypothetical protein